jgi:hypothetical protein
METFFGLYAEVQPVQMPETASRPNRLEMF